VDSLSVVIPVFNEERTLADLLHRVATAPLPPTVRALELVVVDDCSTDASWPLLEGWSPPRRPDGVTLTTVHRRHDRNRGKGAAVRTGFAASTGSMVLVQDADLEYDPREFPKLLGPIVDGLADVVYGSRFLGGPHRVLYFWHYVGNTFFTLLSNMLTDLNLTDVETCHKAFTREVISRLRLVSNRFGIEPEITARVARLGCRIYEVPISYHGRTYREGKKIGWKDGVAAVWSILRFNIWDR
jgi:glycosyltransferase involved in cell wall biosynthesis